MSSPARQSAARSHSPLPKGTVSHTSRDIRFIFLNGCKNITATHTLDGAGTHEVSKGPTSCHPKKQVMGSGHLLDSKKRLPVFQQLCEEATPGTALGDVHLQNSSQELKELPDAQAPREDTKGWMKRQRPGRSPRDKA
ncbi:hypothetical protein N331_01451, partial [Merops nubicus]